LFLINDEIICCGVPVSSFLGWLSAFRFAAKTVDTFAPTPHLIGYAAYRTCLERFPTIVDNDIQAILITSTTNELILNNSTKAFVQAYCSDCVLYIIFNSV
jgi:hypothetical protein